MPTNNNRINISQNQGKVFGVGINGNKNIIADSIIINKVKEDFNLNYLTKDYLERHSDIEDDFKGWLKGFPLSLSSVYQKKEYRREGLIAQIKYKLEEKNRLLLLGESGTSKTTLLMELMCDYLEKDNKVLYSFGDE